MQMYGRLHFKVIVTRSLRSNRTMQHLTFQLTSILSSHLTSYLIVKLWVPFCILTGVFFRTKSLATLFWWSNALYQEKSTPPSLPQVNVTHMYSCLLLYSLKNIAKLVLEDIRGADLLIKTFVIWYSLRPKFDNKAKQYHLFFLRLGS